MKQYYVRRGTTESGPYSSQSIRSMAASGVIRRTDELRAEGSNVYVVASSISGLYVTSGTTPMSKGAPGRPPPLPPTKRACADSPRMQVVQAEAAPPDAHNATATADADRSSRPESPSRLRYAVLRSLGYGFIAAAGVTWFVLEPLTREPLKGEGVVRVARWLRDDNENTPMKMLALCFGIAGLVCVAKSTGRGLTEVSTPEQLGITYDAARDRLFAVGYSSGGKHEDMILGVLRVGSEHVLFRPDRFNALQNNKDGSVNFLRRMVGARAFAIDVGEEWSVPATAIVKVARSGWIVRSVRVETDREVHGRVEHHFSCVGLTAFSRRSQARLFDSFREMLEENTR